MSGSQRLGVAMLVCLAAPGCVTYEARPLHEREVLDELRGLTLDMLRPAVTGEHDGAAAATPGFDVADGLTLDEAVAVALAANPDLRAFRRERGVAEGELIAASLLNDPRLDLSWQYIEHFTNSLGTSAIDLGLSWLPPRPGELDARRALAEAHVEEVRAQIAREEIHLACDVRQIYLTLYTAGERLRLSENALQLRERIRSLIRNRRDLGDASSLDVNLADLEYAETLRENATLQHERERARLALNRALGLPPALEVVLQDGALELAYRALDLDARELEDVMIVERPELVAAKQQYEQAEQGLRLACLKSWPWLELGPAYSRDEIDGEGGNRYGLALGLELPIFNGNRGEIARLEGVRDRLREEFTARVHAARAEVSEALEDLRAQERLIRLYEDSTRPILEENTRLIERGFETGEFNLTQLIATQDKVLVGRRAFLEEQLAYWHAAFDLDRAVGFPVSRTCGKESRP